MIGTSNEGINFCKKCLMLSTRPRLVLDEDGICNACRWAEEKKEEVDWVSREKELKALVEKYKQRNKNKFDILIPSSGGKDSSYVAYQVKEKLGMHPLLATLQPPLPYDIGTKNLEESIKRGFDHIRITPNYEIGRIIAKKSFIEQGQPLMAWIMAVQTSIFKLAVLFDIPFVMFGEEGETEYGGSETLKNKATYSIEESITLYLSGNNPKEFVKEYNFTDQDLYWWTYPTEDEFRKLNPAIAKWSYFENWNPYRNYMVSKEKMGLSETDQRSIGTYTNFAQTDTKLYDLHVYLMFLKFGFGRCTQDVSIDIRRGAITRKQGVNLIKMYDGEYPEVHTNEYLDYFKMTKKEFDDVIDKFANKNILRKFNGKWIRNFEIE
jgi:N-acetyl sugar amidotransferase